MAACQIILYQKKMLICRQKQPMAHLNGSGSAGCVFGDTSLTKVFVGGLAWETQRETMNRYFEQFGEILEAVVITDKNTGRSKGYGFVTFRDPEAATKACADPTPVIDGRRTNCNLASLGARPRPSPSPLGGFQFRALHPISTAPATLGSYVTTPTYAQTAQYAYQLGLYTQQSHYGFPAYSPDYAYNQQSSMYSPYAGAQYAAMYAGSEGLANPSVYTYSAYGQPLHFSGPTYSPHAQAYGLVQPNSHLMQYATTGYTGMPQYTGAVHIHPPAASSGYSLQTNIPSMSHAQASVQQFSIANLSQQQGTGNSEQLSG